jgi:CO/xanthine dehydrogenase FAD-binding subunit
LSTIIHAGGWWSSADLLPYHETMIDVQAVPELIRIEQDDSGATFGAAVSLQTVLEWSSLPQAFRHALTRAIPLNLRSGMSIAESLHAGRMPMLHEWITTLLAHDVGIEYANTEGECSWNNMISLFDRDRLTQDFITAINIPALQKSEALGAASVARTPADAPIVNASAFVTVDADRHVEASFVFVSGASAQPVMQISLPTLKGSPLDEANIASAVKAVAPQVNPVGDYLGSADYRREMARVVVQRALMECKEQLS